MRDRSDLCREALKDRLAAEPRFCDPMPGSLHQSMAAALDEATGPSVPTPPGPRPRSYRRLGALVPVAIAASLAVGILLGRGVVRSPEHQGAEVPRTVADFIHDVTHDHYLFARLDNALEIRQQDPAALQAWLRESLHFSPRLPGDSALFSLEGGRIWHTVNRLSALAAYRLPDGQLAILFAVPAENLSPRGAHHTTVEGLEVFSGSGWDREAHVWYEDDLAVALVAPQGHLPAEWSSVFLH